MAKRYGGKTDGAIQVSISKKSAKDTRYFEVVYANEKKQKSVCRRFILKYCRENLMLVILKR